jgi:DNA-binding MarR family transcriptional regulator
LRDGDEPRPDRLTQADYEALARLRYALRRFMAFSSSAAQAKGLPPQQHQALLAIKGSPAGRAMTVGLLAEQLLIAPHSATELVGRLVDAGLARRESDPGDRRKHVLSLTQEAEDLLAALSAAHLREIREIAPVLVEVLRSLEKPA